MQVHQVHSIYYNNKFPGLFFYFFCLTDSSGVKNPNIKKGTRQYPPSYTVATRKSGENLETVKNLEIREFPEFPELREFRECRNLKIFENLENVHNIENLKTVENFENLKTVEKDIILVN